jgi:hypothetical protein
MVLPHCGWSLAAEVMHLAGGFYFGEGLEIPEIMSANMILEQQSSPRSNVQAIHQIVDRWDFSSVRSYLQLEEKLSPEMTLRMENEYKRFMSVLVGEQQFEKMPISAEVDRFWHAHIMFTRDYTAFSHAIAGEYIHHFPTSSLEERHELCSAYEGVTIPALRRNFGDIDASLWPQGAPVCVGGVSAPLRKIKS